MKHILICYDYFYPGFKAGGPIQSLVNLVQLLQKTYKVSVFTGAYDLNVKESYNEIKINEWNSILLPGASAPVDVWYADTKKLSYNDVFNCINFIKPDILYLNSMYSLGFMIYPIIAVKKLSLNIRVVICPRGMLQNGALKVKAVKKKIFLKCIKVSGLLNKVNWHATNQEEKEDILKWFPKNLGIAIASNIPKMPLFNILPSNKKNGVLNLVYLSLISEKKNLHLILKVLSKSDKSVFLDIYGPLKDIHYWESECLPEIQKLNNRVVFKGDVQPGNVQNVLTKYDALILLTNGENFGHALYESLSVGRPIITSNFTPWNNLEKNTAGWNVDISNLESIVNLLNSLVQINDVNHNSYCKGAFTIANNYYNNQNFYDSYQICFN